MCILALNFERQGIGIGEVWGPKQLQAYRLSRVGIVGSGFHDLGGWG